MKKQKISLTSNAWLKEDTNFVTDRFVDIGFVVAEEIMQLRVYDLLNLNRIDAETAKEAILLLYRIYNPNTSVDDGMDNGMIDQYFPFSAWRKKHPDLSRIIVRDLVMAKDINRRAIIRIWNRILKAFYKSTEYNCREYRFRDYYEMLSKRRAEK